MANADRKQPKQGFVSRLLEKHAQVFFFSLGRLYRNPIGTLLNRNLTVRAGNCPHRALIPELIDVVAAGVLDPGRGVTVREGLGGVVTAYQEFDDHRAGWVKVALDPGT